MQDSQPGTSGPRGAWTPAKSIAARLADLFAVAQGRRLRRGARRAVLIGEISRRVASLTQLDDLLAETARLLSEAMRCEVAVGLVDEEASVLRFRYRTSYRRPGELLEMVNIPLGQGITGRLAARGQPALVRDIRQHPDYIMANPTTRSELAVPLVHQERVLGVLNLESERIGYFNERDLQLATVLAGPIAVAISNARLFEAERVRSSELEALRQASLRLTSSLELQPVLETLLDHALRLVSADGAHIFLYDGEQLTFGAAFWEGSRRQKPYAAPRPDGVTYTAARSGKRVVVPDVNRHPQFRGWEHDGAVIGLPLRSGEQVVGVMNVAFWGPHDFNEDEIRVLELLADQATVAIRNARLYASEHRQRQVAERMLEASAAVTSSLDLGQVLLTLAGQLLDISGSHICAIHEWDQEAELTRALAERTRAFWPLGGREIYRLSDYPTTNRVLTTGEPEVVHVGMDDPELAWMGEVGLVAVLILPLRSGEETIGLAEVGSNESVLAFDRAAVSRCQQVLQEAALRLESPLRSNPEEALLALAGRLSEAAGSPWCTLSAWQRSEGEVRTVVEHADLIWPSGEGPTYGLVEWPDTLRVLGDGASVVARLGDPNSDPSSRNELVRWGARMLVTQPLSVRGEPVGVIELYNVVEDQPVGDEELRLLRAVADQAAIAIENARLYQAEALRAAELEALREVSLDITAELELDALLRSIVERAVKLLDAKAGEIYLHRPERDALVWTVGVGPAIVQPGTELRRGEGLSGRVWEGGQPLLVDYYHRWEGHAADDNQYDYTAVIGVPIAWGEEFLGVINVQADAEVRIFTQDDAHLLSLFAAQAAVAIQNARLHQSTRRRAARLALINRVGQQTTAILDLDELLHQAVNLIGETFGYHNVAIMLAEDGEIVLKAATLPSLHALKDSLRFRIGLEGITGWVAGSGEPLLVPDVSKDDRYYQTVMEETETKSELAVPIKLKGAVIGVLDVQSTGLNAFSRADVFTLQTVADQLAVAIENAHLYTEAVARREQARELAVRLMDAQEEERRRIARELHDQVGQALTAFKLGLEMGADQAADVLPALRDELLNAGRLVDELIDEVRTLSLELRPSTLDDMGLGMALVAYARDTRQHAGLDIDLELPDPPPALPPEVETAAYRIVQEALTNVVRHARASHVSIHLSVADDKLLLDVSDDGVGFDVGQDWFDHKTGHGFGLLGIQERAERLGGRAYMDSQRGQGTRLRVEIPTAALQPHPPNHTPERD